MQYNSNGLISEYADNELVTEAAEKIGAEVYYIGDQAMFLQSNGKQYSFTEPEIDDFIPNSYDIWEETVKNLVSTVTQTIQQPEEILEYQTGKSDQEKRNRQFAKEIVAEAQQDGIKPSDLQGQLEDALVKCGRENGFNASELAMKLAVERVNQTQSTRGIV